MCFYKEQKDGYEYYSMMGSKLPAIGSMDYEIVTNQYWPSDLSLDKLKVYRNECITKIEDLKRQWEESEDPVVKTAGIWLCSAELANELHSLCEFAKPFANIWPSAAPTEEKLRGS